jgi:hypothetical protein
MIHKFKDYLHLTMYYNHNNRYELFRKLYFNNLNAFKIKYKYHMIILVLVSFQALIKLMAILWKIIHYLIGNCALILIIFNN